MKTEFALYNTPPRTDAAERTPTTRARWMHKRSPMIPSSLSDARVDAARHPRRQRKRSPFHSSHSR